MDLRDYETQPAAQFAPALVARTLALLQTGIELIGAVYERHQNDECELGFEPSTFWPGPSDGPSDTNDQGGPLADLCFVAQLELSSRQAPLAAVADADDVWLVLSTCSSVKQKLVKSACAVERALCSYEQLPSLLTATYQAELRVSLQVRHAYNRFRSDVLRGGTPRPETIVERVRKAGVSIARLVGRDVYEHLRSGDRMQLRSFQAQLQAWLRGDDLFSARSGMRLWQDLAAFAGVLMCVNNRSDLRTHDLEAVTEVERALATGTFPGDVVPVPLRERLGALGGRDEELDQLLGSNEPLVVGKCHAVLLRLQEQLGFMSGPFEITPSADADFLETI